MIDVTSNSRLVKISGIGDDRLGIVHAIADVIHQNRGNIILQRSSVVAGDFSITVVAAFAPDDGRGIQNTLAALHRDAFGATFSLFPREITLSNFAPRRDDGVTYVITVSGLDSEGLIAELTVYLLRKNINLDSMDYEVAFDPESGTQRFLSTFEITVSPGLKIDLLEAELKRARVDDVIDVVIRRKDVEREPRANSGGRLKNSSPD